MEIIAPTLGKSRIPLASSTVAMQPRTGLGVVSHFLHPDLTKREREGRGGGERERDMHTEGDQRSQL